MGLDAGRPSCHRRNRAAWIGIDLLRPWLPVGARANSPCATRPGSAWVRSVGGSKTSSPRPQVWRPQRQRRVISRSCGRHFAAASVGKSRPPPPARVRWQSHTIGLPRCATTSSPDRPPASFSGHGGDDDDVLRGRASLRKLGRNLAAAFKLPFVYLGWARDPWNCFAKYAALEQKWRSTFYIIPRRDHPGRRAPHGDIDPRRACRYQASEVAADLTALAKAGFEVGLHGLDAWTGLAEATAERSDIRKAGGGDASGVRMHWLYFSDKTYETLDRAGFGYDSTFGFNDAVGFRAGTGQVFRPLGANHLVEIPPTIQDTALFYTRRMHLDEAQAFAVCEQVMAEACAFGGWTHACSGTCAASCQNGGWDISTDALDIASRRGGVAPAAEIVEFLRRRRAVAMEVSWMTAPDCATAC